MSHHFSSETIGLRVSVSRHTRVNFEATGFVSVSIVRDDLATVCILYFLLFPHRIST